MDLKQINTMLAHFMESQRGAAHLASQHIQLVTKGPRPVLPVAFHLVVGPWPSLLTLRNFYTALKLHNADTVSSVASAALSIILHPPAHRPPCTCLHQKIRIIFLQHYRPPLWCQTNMAADPSPATTVCSCVWLASVVSVGVWCCGCLRSVGVPLTLAICRVCLHNGSSHKYLPTSLPLEGQT